MRDAFDGAPAPPALPQAPAGRPFFLASFLSDVQLSPPSRETNRSEPGPPLVRSHGRRRACQNPAKITRGLFGSMAMSEQPVSSSLNRTRFQVFPPSVVR